MRNVLFVLTAIVFICVAGCNPFAPSLTDDLGGAGTLTNQATPQDVMTNFEISYDTKNIVAYGDLIDSSFIFISKDFSTNPVTDLTWGRDDELRSTEGLFNNFNILRLDWNGTIYEIYPDSATAELKQSFLLTLGSGIDVPTYSGEALFTLIKKNSGKWKILRWEDGNLL